MTALLNIVEFAAILVASMAVAVLLACVFVSTTLNCIGERQQVAAGVGEEQQQ
jgi:hypothetical protein